MAGVQAVEQEGAEPRAVAGEQRDRPPVRVDPPAVGVGEQQVVVLGQEPHRRRRVRVRPRARGGRTARRRPRAERPQPVAEPVDDLAQPGQPAPGLHVPHAHRPEARRCSAAPGRPPSAPGAALAASQDCSEVAAGRAALAPHAARRRPGPSAAGTSPCRPTRTDPRPETVRPAAAQLGPCRLDVDAASRAAASTSPGRPADLLGPLAAAPAAPRPPLEQAGRQARASRAVTRWMVIRIREARTTRRRRIRSASWSASNSRSRVHSPTYGESGACACMPASRSMAAAGETVGALEQHLPGQGRPVQRAQAQDGRLLTRCGPRCDTRRTLARAGFANRARVRRVSALGKRLGAQSDCVRHGEVGVLSE